MVTGGLGRVLHLADDPKGSAVAVIFQDGRMRGITVEDAQIQQLAQSTPRRGRRSDLQPGRALAGLELSPAARPPQLPGSRVRPAG